MRILKKITSAVLAVILAFTGLPVPFANSDGIPHVYAAGSIDIGYENFANTHNLQLNGSSLIENNAIQFDGGTGESVFTTDKVTLDENLSFSTAFSFRNIPPSAPEDETKGGFTFTLQSDANTFAASDFQYESIYPSLSIAFTADYMEAGTTASLIEQARNLRLASLSDIKLAGGAMTRCEISAVPYLDGDYSSPLSQLPIDTYPADETSGNYKVWLGYDGVEELLHVLCLDPSGRYTYSRNNVVLADTLLTNEVYAGFMGSIGNAGNTSEISSWYFKNDLSIIDKAIADADKARLTSEMEMKEVSPVEDSHLPQIGFYGSTISWESSNTDVVAVDGTINPPSLEQGNQTVTLTATITKGSVSCVTRSFTVTIKVPDGIIAYADHEWLTYSMILNENHASDNVVSDVYLPTSGQYGSIISWSSTNDAVADLDGTITRPSYSSGDEEVTLSAYINMNWETREKTFDITVKALGITDEDIMNADFLWLTAAQLNPDLNNVTADIILPTLGQYGSTITWASDKDTIVDTYGNVARPTYIHGDEAVTLTATISRGSFTTTKEFIVIVIKLGQTDEEMLEVDDAWLTDTLILNENSDMNSVTEDVYLPPLGPNGSTITWTSGNTGIVNTNGVITRPAYALGDAAVTLTATISRGSFTTIKYFTVTVIKLGQTDKEKLDADDAWLTDTLILNGTPDLNPDLNSVTEDVYLPLLGPNGSTITWASGNIGIVNTDGVITRPAYALGDATVTLTATISRGTFTTIKYFTATVIKLGQTDMEMLDADDAWLTDTLILNGTPDFNPDLNSVTKDVYLPLLGPNGSTITWASDNTDVLLTNGSVIRPTYIQKDKTVTLTAIIRKGALTSEKTFNITVKALEQTDLEAVNSDIFWLTNSMEEENSPFDNAIKDLYLPTSGINGTTIRWVSSNTAVVGINGKVTRPTYVQGDKTVKLTATISRKLDSTSITYTIIVKRLDITVREAIDEDLKWLIGYNVLGLNPSGFSVTHDLSFPDLGPYGSPINWISDKSGVISNSGVVTRPKNGAGHQSVNIKAVAYRSGLFNSTTFTYTVPEEPDILAPVVVGTTPGSNSTGVSWDTNEITVTYSENMVKGTSTADMPKNLGIELQAADSPEFAVTIDKNKLTIQPYSYFSAGENKLLIPAGAITDEAGNPAEACELKFEVEEKLIRNIEVASSTPNDLVKDVAVNIPRISFSYNISDIVAGDGFDGISLRTRDGSTIPATVSLSANTVTMDIREPLADGTVYEIVIPAGAVQDRFLNNSNARLIQFKTKPIPIIPRIISVYPADGQTYVDTKQPIEIVFAEEVKPEDCKLQLKNVQFNLTHKLSVRAKNQNTLVITSNNIIEPNTLYSLTGSYYSEKNPLQPEFSMQFKTGPWTNLQITGTSRTSNVPVNGSVEIIFSNNIFRDQTFENIKLLDSEGNIVAYTIREEYYRVFIAPVTDFKPSEVYTVFIPKGAYTDKSGRITNNDFRFSFTTAKKLSLGADLLEVSSYWFAGKNIPINAELLEKTIRSTGRKFVSYEWDYGDGITETGNSPVHTYREEGNYEINLKIKDSMGFSYELKKPVTIKALNDVHMTVNKRFGNNFLYVPLDATQLPSVGFSVILEQNGEFVPGENIGVQLHKQGALIETYKNISANTGDSGYLFTFKPPSGSDGIYELVFTYDGIFGQQIFRQPIIIQRPMFNTLKFRLYDVNTTNPARYFEEADYIHVILDGQRTPAIKRWQEALGYYAYEVLLPLISYKQYTFDVEGWADDKDTIYLGGTDSLPVIVKGKPVRAGITRITYESEFPIKEPDSNIFFENCNQYIRVNVEGDWKGLEPGYYEYKTDKERVIGRLYYHSTRKIPYSMNVGSQVKAGDQLLVRMVTKNGVTSPWQYCPRINVLPQPRLMGEGIMVQGYNGNYEILWPTVFDGVIGDVISKLKDIPFIDGGYFGLGSDMPFFQGYLDTNNNKITLNLDIGTTDFIYGREKKNTKDTKIKQVKKVTAVGYNFNIEVEGGLTFEYESKAGEWKLKRLVIDIDGYAGKYWSSGYKIGGVIGVTGMVEMGVNAGGTLIVDRNSDGNNYSGIIRLGPEMEVSVTGSYGVGEVRGSVTADIPAEIHIPTGYIGADITVNSKITASFVTYETTLYEKKLVGEHWDNGKKKLVLRAMMAPTEDSAAEYSGLRLMPRDYAGRQSIWLAGEDTAGLMQKSGVMLRALAPVESNPQITKLMENIYPKADIRLIQSGGRQWLVWSDDNRKRDAVNRTQLRYSVLNDGQWSEPLWIGGDETADSTPVTTAVGSGSEAGVLMAWQNIGKVVTEEEGLGAMLEASEISVTESVYTAAGSPNIINLTNDDKLDHSPRLAADGEKALLVWTKSEGLCLSLDPDTDEYLAPEQSDKLFFSTWENGAWSTPEQIEGSLPSVLDSYLAMQGEEGLLLYTLDMDNDSSTQEDREVFARLYNGESWGDAIQLGDNLLADSAPKAVNIDGKWFITWIQDGSIVYRSGLNGEIRTEESLRNVQNGYELAIRQGTGPLIALVWRKSGIDKAQGISASFYDVDNDMWSDEISLVDPHQYTGSISAGFTEDGKLNVAYSQAELISEMVPEVIEGVEQFVEKTGISNKVDLKLLTYLPVHDLALEDRLYLSTEAPLPGTLTTVYATIRNKGDFAEKAVLHLFDGDPDDGGEKIGETVVTQLIPAHSSFEAEIKWLVGLKEKDKYDLYAVANSDSGEEDINEDNNTKHLEVLTADIAIGDLAYENVARDDYLVTVTIVNSGSRSLEGAEALLEQETGSEAIGRIPIERLQPGQETVITYLISAAHLPKDENGLINMSMEVRLPEEIEENFSDNNMREFSLKPASIMVERLNPGPSDNHVDVANAMSLVFNMNVGKGAGFDRISLIDEELDEIAIDKAIEGDTLTITPQKVLEYGTGYTLTLPSDALGDSFGHTMDEAYNLSFTTTSRNPEVVFAYPGNGIEGAEINTDIRFMYNQSVTAGSEYTDIALYGPDSELIPVSVSIAGEYLTMYYTGKLMENSTYLVEVPGGAVQNDSGVVQQEDYVLAFTTGSADEEENTQEDDDSTEDDDGTVSAVIGGIQRIIDVQTGAGGAVINLESYATDIFSGDEDVVLDISAIPNTNAFTMVIPANSLTGAYGKASLSLKTDIGSIMIPSGMLSGMSDLEGRSVNITMAVGDKSKLPDDIRAAIGDHPFIQLMLTIDGQQVDWDNPAAPVKVSIPYTPTAPELANLESIVIWYIDGDGNIIAIPNGHYRQSTGEVSFSTTHFSDFAVAYNKIDFKDVQDSAWYESAVSFIAARGITTGTGNGNFSPDSRLTRGQFITIMLRAYSIEPDTNAMDNFSDAGNTWYTGYLAAAKELGISEGVGNNMFAPDSEITRQEMLTLLYNVLKVIQQLPEADGADAGRMLTEFTDQGQIASWAREAMTLLVETGTINGNAGKLAPLSTASRAEMAQVLYNLMTM